MCRPRSWQRFQSTHPLRGATQTNAPTRQWLSISIHAPLAGCDRKATPKRNAKSNFNPRTPCGVRHDGTLQLQRSNAHFNPRTPCGVRRRRWSSTSRRAPFQSTHPLRGATRPKRGKVNASRFQSTHPLRGATIAKRDVSLFVDISIHAPLAGCDPGKGTGRRGCREFQSTHPLRGATYDGIQAIKIVGISIHAPLAGCDAKQSRNGTPRAISIHAPLAGCDFGNLPRRFLFCHFNPRTPCGVRRHRPYYPGNGRDFNPRTPCGVRQTRADRQVAERDISIHAPLAGCDVDFAEDVRKAAEISIHAPLAGCDAVVACIITDTGISIHAPLAGCDAAADLDRCQRPYFNPRTPCGVRLHRCPGDRAAQNFNPRTPCGVRLPNKPPLYANYNFNPRTPCGVRRALPACSVRSWPFQSTHPLRGATIYRPRGKERPRKFQSTHPLRGATVVFNTLLGELWDFNPRTPCGVRREQGGVVYPQDIISIHAPLAGCDGRERSEDRADHDFNPRTPCGVRRARIPTGAAA